MTKATFQMIVDKLDRGFMDLKEAKKFAARFGAKPEGRTKEQFIRSLSKQVTG